MADEQLRKWGKNIATTRSLRNSNGDLRRPGQDEMSQAELGAMLDPPVTQATVSRWEAGLMEPRRAYKAQIAIALGVNPEALFPMAWVGVPA